MQEKILRRPEVIKMIGVSATTIWRMEKAGLFPKHLKISVRTVGWRESEVLSWLAGREKVKEHQP